MRKSTNLAAQNLRKLCHFGRRSVNGNHDGFSIINFEASVCSKVKQKVLDVVKLRCLCICNQYGIVSILNNGIILAELMNQWCSDEVISFGLIQHCLKNICSNDKDEGRQWVSLSNPRVAMELSPWYAI